ncbi:MULTISPECIES: S1C family serine protease [Streptomyces diastaticus group]|uniref:Protease n=3 Tax=Streptomyces TaxID=1883 RepID=A0A8H9HHX3_9ACTN|nr:trypsin-like peptidase domain-containing protein [Streptomyces gougerotii]WSU35815.1 trypsin-like peptidase domain-containing protein [Streptomyces gougerotii]GFH77045.1 protease [Streptomyces gougerotii]GGU66627.1 protease [Streptomyces gougerotii]
MDQAKPTGTPDEAVPEAAGGETARTMTGTSPGAFREPGPDRGACDGTAPVSGDREERGAASHGSAVAAETTSDTAPDAAEPTAPRLDLGKPAGTTTVPGPRSAAAPDAPGAADAPAFAERPRPLHAPDPYSTPPYGEPGPWAPAPPVQRPVPTPAHGTRLPPGQYPGTPAHGTPVPEGARPQPGGGGDWGRYDPWAAPGAPAAEAGGGPGQRRRERRAGRGRLAGAALVLALVAGSVGGYVGMRLERHGGLGAVELEQAAGEAGERAPDSVAGIAARTLPGVVTLHVSGGEGGALGTGFVLDDRGHILTNQHVVDSAGNGGSIRVTFNGGETARARLVGGDPGYDLAVVKVSGVSGLTPLPLGDSDDVRVGDPVVAIGAPFDLANTVTAGIISAKERPITAGGEKGDGTDISYVDALQTDAPINPGNSGGPLVDERARVIGINSAIHAPGGPARQDDSAGSVGLGFAIPVNQAKRVAEELINHGRATHPVIGVTLDMGYEGEGAKVGGQAAGGGSAVTPGGPADKADIVAGDVITEVDGVPVASGEELIIKIRSHRPGDRLGLTVERAGEPREVTLELGSSDAS